MKSKFLKKLCVCAIYVLPFRGVRESRDFSRVEVSSIHDTPGNSAGYSYNYSS